MLALIATAAGAGALALPAGAERGAGQKVNVSWSGLGAERVKTVPITRRPGAKTRVAMSLPPSKVGPVRPGDQVWAGAEIEVSVTCLEPMPKCVGKIYHYSPHTRVRLALAPGPKASKPANYVPISDWQRLRCSQKLPNRNHHCVLAVTGNKRLGARKDLPCGPCYVNLLLDAHHRGARKGNVLVVGSDDDNRISQNKGMLNAATFRPGPAPSAPTLRTKRASTRKVPIGGTKRVVLSRRVGKLRAGEQLLIDAKVRGKVGHLPYNALIQSQIVLSEKPGSIKRKGLPTKIASQKGMVTALNGFNCTRGSSGHRDPCLVRKVGVVRVFKNARAKFQQNAGRFKPLYVNLVVQSKSQYGGQFRAGHVLKIAKRANMSVTRFGSRYR